MPIVITERLEIPAHWLPALINGDLTGLSDTDERQLEAFMDGMLDVYPRFDVQIPTDEPYFCKYHDAHDYGVLACDVYEVNVIVGVQE